MNKQKLIYLLFLFFIAAHLSGQALATKYWVFFTDKGPEVIAQSTAAYKQAGRRISQRALVRRAKMKPDGALLDTYDLPVSKDYLQAIEAAGFEIKVVSRWLNACSVVLAKDQLTRLLSLPFVARITPVHAMTPVPEISGSESKLGKVNGASEVAQFDYGPSIDQITQINVQRLHNADIAGAGVLVGLLDSGFNYKNHPAFSHLVVVDEHDFVFGDELTANQIDDIAAQHNHGTQVLSVAAGFAPGHLVGPAYRAEFILAKTEDLRSETPAEEDNWVAAIEWMEARGVDVASTSLGYSDFDAPWTDYTWADLDGNTATVSIAAEIAVMKGVVVVCSAGNEGNKSWRYITPPADARDVISVGAVQKSGERAAFSSLGPSFYSRLKPDVMALGANVSMVNPAGEGYTTNGGTSFSAPLVAGVVAQILSVHPELTPLQIMEALHSTASRANAPDSLSGWGIVDAVNALTYWGPAFGKIFHVDRSRDDAVRISAGFLGGPAVDSTSIKIHWRPESAINFTFEAMSPVANEQYQSQDIPVFRDELTEFYLTVANKAGDLTFFPDTAGGHYFSIDYLGRIPGFDEAHLLPPNPGNNFYLFHPFPNPFVASANQSIRLAFDLQEDAYVELNIYNMLGQIVARPLAETLLLPGAGFRDWSGVDRQGHRVATGVYFLVAKFRQMNGKVVIKKRKLLLLN